MPSEFTVFEQGSVIVESQMNDDAFREAVEEGWEKGKIISLNVPPYLFFVEEMCPPQYDPLGICQVQPGQVILERFVPQ